MVLIGGTVALVALIGLGLIFIPSRQVKPETSESQLASNSDPSKTTTKQSTGDLKRTAEKEALDWLFSVGATVSVGTTGSLQPVKSTEEAMSFQHPVVSVVLDQRPISDQDLVHLVALPEIESLSLFQCAIGDRGLIQIGRLLKLRSIELGGTKVTDYGLKALLACSNLWGLYLSGTQVTADALETVAEFPNLTRLIWEGLPVSPQSLKHLQRLKKLNELILGSSPQLTDDCAQSIALISSIEILTASQTQIGPSGLKNLATMPDLRSLNLDGSSNIGDECGVEFVHLPALGNLSIRGTPFGDRGLEDLLKTSDLKFLSLSGTRVSANSFPALSRARQLVAIDLAETSLSADEMRRLAAAMPWCQISSSFGVHTPTNSDAGSSVLALEFNGKTSCIELPLIPFDSQGPMTIEAWFLAWPKSAMDVDNPDASLESVCSFLDPASMRSIQFTIDPPNRGLRFGAGDGKRNRTSFCAFPMDASNDLFGKRHHAAFVRDGDDVRIYVDGQLKLDGGSVANSNSPGDQPSAMWKFLIGAGLGRDGKMLAQFLRGTIDELRFSKVARYSETFVPEQDFSNDVNTLALYHFDEGMGYVLKDSSNNEYDGKIIDAEWVAIDIPANLSAKRGLKFDGKGFVEIPSLVWNGSDSMTVEIVCTPDSTTGPGPAFLMLWPSQERIEELSLYEWDFNVWGFDHRSATGSQSSVINGIRRNRRVLLTCICDGKKTLMEVNGVRSASRTMDHLPFNSRSALLIGGEGQVGFHGTIEQVRISKGIRKALPAPPVGNLPKDDATIALYKVDEGSGNSLNDASGNDHHGKIIDAKWVIADEGVKRP